LPAYKSDPDLASGFFLFGRVLRQTRIARITRTRVNYQGLDERHNE